MFFDGIIGFESRGKEWDYVVRRVRVGRGSYIVFWVEELNFGFGF